MDEFYANNTRWFVLQGYAGVTIWYLHSSNRVLMSNVIRREVSPAVRQSLTSWSLTDDNAFFPLIPFNRTCAQMLSTILLSPAKTSYHVLTTHPILHPASTFHLGILSYRLGQFATGKSHWSDTSHFLLTVQHCLYPRCPCSASDPRRVRHSRSDFGGTRYQLP